MTSLAASYTSLVPGLGTRLIHHTHSVTIIVVTMHCLHLTSTSEFSVDSVSHLLLKVKFPPEKWCTLARGLTVASAVSIIDANHRDVERKLLAVISHWVKSTTQHNQWITLVEAVIMCDECGVAEQLATAVGVEYIPPSSPPPPPHSGMLHVHNYG